jgi:hypothetical protein
VPRRKKNAERVNRRIRSAVKPAGRCWAAKKYGYNTQGEAEAALADIRQRRQAAGTPEADIEKRSYLHHICGRWHLTRETDAEYIAARENWVDRDTE